ncbi:MULTISPECIES: DUF2207 domain-containing protein [Alphaproteobacteria]|uniref:Membrane protein n=2 Tax=Alphaproteobacteria TaxID=28211 RepID=A0A512HHY4_9HYPH|nr:MULTISPECIES: DUF2207 domain-containing protein [Alphaproteobacteria]GEO85059.1 membrane protein [Ciceribacter naphthalenivorans]GLR24607.1 membrane protein [Ciceribacter naphthalenivorans]GLT07463.1 membrane protein [Sphingomonas psychrolutea]
MKAMLGLLTAVFLVLAAAGQSLAAEVIRDYHADIAVSSDATLTVTETITVRAEGQEIKRGIFRDFPLYAEDADGRRVEVDFNLLSVERDGEPEDYHTESITGGIRIYAGSADVFLDPGDYTYTITYTTGRQIRYFDDHDELYWNVTGNGWRFPILKASALVTLPGGATPTRTAYYTGYLGSTATNACYEMTAEGPYFETTERLGIGNGLTIVVGLPKGTVSAPSSEQVGWWWIRDNINAILGFGGLGLVALYYLRFWIAVGRDPKAGVMVPRWDPPDGISPALVNYIDNKGFSGEGWTALSASLLDLAVKGYVVLDDLEKSIVVQRTEKQVTGKLSAGQAALIASLGKSGDEFTIDKANGKRVQSVGNKFRGAIEKEHRGKYYQANTGYIVGGVVLSVAALAALLIFGSLTEDTIGLLFAPIMLSLFLGIFAVRLGKGVQRGAALPVRIISIIGLAVLGFVAIAVVIFTFLAIFIDFSDINQLHVLIAVGGIVLLNVLFFFLMGAPTPVGRKLMDGIEGLRTYMTLAEKDRLNMQGAPKMSPQHFETLLPYAVALGVEKPWTRTFEIWLASAAAGAAAASYQPTWYHGAYPGGFGGRIGGFSRSMASTIASTIPAPPKSSSSGFSSGGGFSGGGGGGGGGGGW